MDEREEVIERVEEVEEWMKRVMERLEEEDEDESVVRRPPPPPPLPEPLPVVVAEWMTGVTGEEVEGRYAAAVKVAVIL